jgi:hypothetical protein
MTDLSANVQNPALVGVAPVYTAVTAADFFVAQPNARYVLHYKNGATLTGAGSFKVSDPTTPIPTGSGAAAGFADALIQNAGMAATTELVAQIAQSNRFRDSNGRINLAHTGTLTTVSVAVFGPFPA